MIQNFSHSIRLNILVHYLQRFKFLKTVFRFSFEAGRRCPTGPGIYAFRCSRAENLFNLLQSRVRNPYIDDHSPFGDQRPEPTPREPALPNMNRQGNAIGILHA